MKHFLAMGRALSVLVLAVATACIGSTSAPSVAPNRTLSIAAGDGAPAPFAVVFAGPEGNTSPTAQITMVFNRPVRELTLAGQSARRAATANQTGEGPATSLVLTPRLGGTWQWVGTNAVLFAPAGGRLPAATRIKVEVPASFRALDGSTLGKPHRFELVTPRPALVRSTPDSGEQGIEPGRTIELRFNQPIAPRALEAAATLEATRAGKTRSLRFRAVRPDAKNGKLLTIEPAEPLPIHSQIELAVSDRLVGEAGPLPSGAPASVAFETYGPLEVKELTCNDDTPEGGCVPGSPLYLQLSNPVKVRDLRGAVSVEPALRLVWSPWVSDSDDEWTSSIELVGKFAPGRTYNVVLKAGLRDRYGQSLTGKRTRSLRIGDFWPRVELGVSGDYIEPSAQKAIPIGSVNTKSYELFAARLPVDKIAEYYAKSDKGEGLALLPAFPGFERRTVRPAAAKNQLARHTVDPARLLGGATGRGPVVVAVRSPSARDGRSDEEHLSVLQVTDLAITAKLSRHGSLVWVTRLSSGTPVAGADVEIREGGRVLGSYRANDQGLVTVPPKDFAPIVEDYRKPPTAVVVARAGGDWSYRRVASFIESWRVPAPASFSGQDATYGMLFSDRGLYRPGDTVRLKGIVRRHSKSGNEVVSGKSFDVAVSSPLGEVASQARVTTTQFGTFALDVKVPRGAALGSWRVTSEDLAGQSARRAAAANETGGRLDGSFEVAEYRPAEFEVTVEPARPAFIRGDRGKWRVGAEYLFGAPMARAETRFTLTREATSFAPPNSDGFVTSDDAFVADRFDTFPRAATLRSQSIVLDAHGAAAIEEALSLSAQRGPELVTLDAEVTDISRQSIAGRAATLVHPAEYYVGLAYPERYFLESPGKVDARVVALSPEGRKLAGKIVKVELVQRRWTLARQKAGDATHAVSTPVDKVTASCTVSTDAARPAPCTLAVDEGGYYILHATSQDARHNAIGASMGLFAIGKGMSSWGDRDDQQVELAFDRKSYRVGETARVLVKSPFPEAEALVTVERAGIHRSERRRLKGPTQAVEIPVTADLMPNAFVGVHLIRGRSSPAVRGKPDVGRPAYRMGYGELRVDSSAKRLKVDVRSDKDGYAPGQNITVDLQVRDAEGKPRRAEVTLYAADEGVLSLIGYKTPDPYGVFTAPRVLEVATLEAREALAEIALSDPTLGADKGFEGGGGGADGARRDFRQSLYFNPSIITDEKGRARVSFKLGESLTTYRLMAVAVTDDDRYGSGEARVTTSSPLMARPALPRLFRTGDKVEAGIVLTAKNFGPATVTVRATASGLALIGEAARTVRLEKNGSTEVRFSFGAERAGEAKLRFSAETSGASDVVEVTRRIETPASFEAVALYGRTERDSAERIGDLAAARRDVGRLDVTLASTALVGLGGGIEQLVEYPYGCTEQLSSRLLPLVPLATLARDFSIALPKDARAIVEKTVGDILERQRPDGGFGMWPESAESFSWVSAYALFTLNEAKKRGATVPKRVFDLGIAYLRRELRRPDTHIESLATLPFIVDVLAELGSPDPGYVTRLYEARRDLPLFSKALLLHAMAVSKHDAKTAGALNREIEGELIISANTAKVGENVGDRYAVLMDSPVRSTAMVLRALLAHDASHPLAPKLARALLDARRGGAWRSTQETAYSLLALDEYRRAQEKQEPDFVATVWFGQSEVTKERFAGRSVLAESTRFPLAKLGVAGSLLTFRKEGTGILFYEARLTYAKRVLPKDPLDRGFFVQKTFRPVSIEDLPKALETMARTSARELSAGTLVLADVLVVTPSPRDYVVIDDPLPAGLEAIDARLATTARWLDAENGDGSGEPCPGCVDEDDIATEEAFREVWDRRELHDDRVLYFVDHLPAGMFRYRYLARATTHGSFVVPPTKAEEMYSPEVFGRTGATAVEVR